MNNLEVGIVTEVSGNAVVIQMHETSNPPVYYVDNVFYHGISVGSFIGVLTGPYKIILRIEKESIEDKTGNPINIEFTPNSIVRKVTTRIVGYLLQGEIHYGLEHLPFIYNTAVLLSEKEIEQILTGRENSHEIYYFKLGYSLETKTPITIDWRNIFNTHIGIFGNTGSGKSNTLASLYTKLFDLQSEYFNPTKSRFLFIDFSGEYSDQSSKTLAENKQIIKLSTRGGGDKIKINKETFWNKDTLAILFSATEKTQKPFLSSVLYHHVDIEDHKLIPGWIERGFRETIEANNNKESMGLLRQIIKDSTRKDVESLNVPNLIKNSQWHGKYSSYYLDSGHGKPTFWGTITKEEIDKFCVELKEILNYSVEDDLSTSEILLITCQLELLHQLARNNVQFDHINPVINRIKSRRQIIDNLFEITEEPLFGSNNVIVLCLKDCDLDAKKTIPLLLAIQSYHNHKENLEDSKEKTFHLIIDEAHNILSEQSNRETENWKDYRLEVFEEIIKEGRKFGFFLTIASQRPSDISPTIVSQIHNFFIHRLVNEKDLFMMTSTIASLDSVTKQKIPSLSPGQCIMLGTSFKFPILVKVDYLENRAPKSETIDLEDLWYFDNIPF